MTSRLDQVVAAGPLDGPGPHWGCFATLSDPMAAEALGRLGFDFILIDLQHGAGRLDDLVPLLLAVEAGGAVPLVRLRSDEPSDIGYALDLGAWAVVVPMVESADQTERVVAAARYAPQGNRSFGPIRPSEPPESGRVMVMLETARGLARVDEIAAVDGLLGILAGPSDLALSLGLPLDYPVGAGPHQGALERISAACARAGIVAAIQTAGAAEAKLRAAQGFHWISMRSDRLIMQTEARRMLAEVEGP